MGRKYEAPREKGLYDPNSEQPFALSRVRIELFKRCMRCFYIDRKLGIDQPPGFPFKLNSAVDAILKRDFDAYRENGWEHPLIEEAGIDARPAQHENLETWRSNFKGVRFLHAATNLEIFGAIDDLWVNSDGEHNVVDYKATARRTPVATIEDLSHGDGYKRQLEVYQWLLRQQGLEVSDTAYWLYCTGDQNAGRFNKEIRFDVNIIPYEGDDSWVEPTLHHIKNTLDSPHVPDADENCDHCKYAAARQAIES